MFDFPNAPANGQTVTMPDGTTRQWDGTRWVAGSTHAAPIVTIGDTPPAGAQAGWLWWDSVGAQLYIYYNDGTSSQWVPANAQNIGVNEAPTDGGSYVRQNSIWVPASSVQSVQNNVGRNLLHNGLFNVQQRGAGPWTGTSQYTADRWFLGIGGSDTVSATIATAADSDRTGIGDEAVRNVWQNNFTGSAVAGSYTVIYQNIETVRRLSGKTVTVSFWARASVSTPRLALDYTQSFGTGGTPSANVTGSIGVTPALTATWTRYSFTIALPSAAGKVLGTNGNDYTQLAVWLSDQPNYGLGGIGVQSGTVEFWGVQLEIGNIATPLEKLDPRLDLANCQRFYQTMSMINGAYGPAGITVYCSNAYAVPPRAAPSVTVLSSGNANVSNAAAAGDPWMAYMTGQLTGTGAYYFNVRLGISADL